LLAQLTLLPNPQVRAIKHSQNQIFVGVLTPEPHDHGIGDYARMNLTQHSKMHLDRFSRFHTAHSRVRVPQKVC